MERVYNVHKKRTRERILAAADRILRVNGFGKLTIRQVAAHVQLSPMAIYRHFHSKDELIAALVAAGFQKWELRLQSAVSHVSSRQKLRNAMLAYRDFALQEPKLFELMFLVRRADVPVAPASLQSSPSPAFSQVIAAVRQSISEGSLAHADVAETILLVWSAAHGIITLHFAGRFGHNDEVFRNIFARTIDHLLKALRSSNRRRR
jgi:AcrR family transcriptional regulator